MNNSLDAIARQRMEEEFGAHATEVMNAGWLPPQGLQLRLQEVVPSTPSRYRPEFGDPDGYLQSVYRCLQQ